MSHGNRVTLALLISLAATVAVLLALSSLDARAAIPAVNRTTDDSAAPLSSETLRPSTDRSSLCATADFTYPLTIPFAISDTFGSRLLLPGDYSYYDFHRGIDWSAPEGTPVRAVTTGTVRDLSRDWVSGYGSGNFVHLTHEQIECETRYNHLSAVHPVITEGLQVTPGQIIGWVGHTGAHYNHLHFEARRGLTVTQRSAVHPLSTHFLPWTNHLSPTVTLRGIYTDSTGLTALVQVTSPYTEPDVTAVGVTVSGAVTDSRDIDYVGLNASTLVVAKLDDPLVNDVCMIPADLNAANGYSATLAFRHLRHGSTSTITAHAADVDGWGSTDTANLIGGLEVMPPEQIAQGVPSQAVTFVYTLTNRTGASDTFTLTHLSAQGWPAIVTPTTYTLDNGAFITATVVVTTNTDRFGPPDCGLLVATAHSDAQRVAAGFYRIYRDAYVSATGQDSFGAGSTITPFKTISYAISQTDAGGTVHVAQGTYTENLVLERTVDLLGSYASNWATRSLTASPTIVDGDGKGAVLVVDGDYGPLIEGFTFFNGHRHGGAGGGVRLVNGAAPTLRSNWILSNTADLSGGGIYISATFCLTSTIIGNIIAGNTSGSAAGGGGGLYVMDCPALIQGNTISGNQATQNDGGGLHLTGKTTAEALGNRILSNEANGDGGGVLVRSSGVYLANNLIRYNTAGNNGNGIRVAGSSAPRLYHNTLAANRPESGAGLYVGAGSTPTVASNVVAGHAAGIHCGSQVTLSFSALSNTINLEGSCADDNNIIANLRLRDEVHLLPDSLAIDAAVNVGVNDDIDGEPRPAGAGYDIGADEFPAALSVTIQASPDPAQAGAQLTCALRVTNTGNVNLHALVTDTLPTHITPGQTSSGTLILPGGALTWTPIITAPGGVWTETVVVTIEMGYAGPLTNVVQVTTDEGATGIYTATTTAQVTPSLVISKRVVPDPAQAGAPLTYTLHVTNTGNVTLTAIITDALPNHITGGHASGGTLLLPGGTIAWTPIITAPDGVWIETFVVTVEMGYAGLLTNIVEVTTVEGAAGIYTETTAVFVPCAGLMDVELAGPVRGTLGAACVFTAAISPVTATTPITYTWQATGQSDVVTTTNSLSHAVSLVWITPGPKIITVTAANACGAQVATHTIAIETPPPTCHALTGVQVAGPLTGTIGAAHVFTATVAPVTATTPITYTWQATGQSDVVTTTNALSHAVSFAWMTAGPKVITVTAANACDVHVATHAMTIETPLPTCRAMTGAELAGPLTSTIGAASIFTATVSPLEATLPITYTWRATEQTPVIHTISRVTDTVAFTWAIIGAKTVVVTATNACNIASGDYDINIGARGWYVYLPLIVRQ